MNKKLLLAVLLIAVFLPDIYSQTKVTHTTEKVVTAKSSIGLVNVTAEKAKIKDNNTGIITSKNTVCVGVGVNANVPGSKGTAEVGAELRKCDITETVISNPSKTNSTISSYNASMNSATPKITHTTELILPATVSAGPAKLTTENSIVKDNKSGIVTYKNTTCPGVGLKVGVETPIGGTSISKDDRKCTTVETVIYNPSKSISTNSSSAPKLSSTTSSAAKMSYAPPVNSSYATPINNKNNSSNQSYAKAVSSPTPIKNTSYNSNVSSTKKK
jgi:hypothetical protein